MPGICSGGTQAILQETSEEKSGKVSSCQLRERGNAYGMNLLAVQTVVEGRISVLESPIAALSSNG